MQDRSTVWRNIRAASKPAHRAALPGIHGAKSFTEKCNTIRKEFLPATPTHHPPLTINWLRPVQCDLTVEFEEIAAADIDRALHGLPTAAATGIDGLNYRILAVAPNVNKELVTTLITALISFGITPLKWTTAKIDPIPKSRNDDYTAAKAY